MENCLSSLCTHQRPLNHLQTAILKLLGSPWLGLYGLGGHYVGPHGCSSTRIVTKSSPKPILGATAGFQKKANFGNLAGVTKQPTQRQISGLLGGPWLGLYRLGSHCVGPHGCSGTLIVTKSSPKPTLGVTEGFWKKANFGNLAGVTKQPTQRPFWGFWGDHGSGYMGLAATTWVPMGAQVPVLSLNHHPNPSQGRQQGFRKSRILLPSASPPRRESTPSHTHPK